MIKQRSRIRRSQKLHNPSQSQPVRQATTGDAASTQVGVHRGAGGHQAGAARKRPPWYRRPQSRRRAQASAVVPADIKQAPRIGACKPIVAKMASHAIFQYNILVIDIDNTTLGLI